MVEPQSESPARQTNNSSARVDNRGASYRNVRDVYNGPVTHQTVVKDNSVTYEVGHDDVRGMERFSMWIIERIGEGRVKVAAAVTVLLGGGGVISLTNSSIHLPQPLWTPVFLASGTLILAGSAFIAALKFKADSRCTKCNRFYAMQEFGEPIVKESPRKGGTQRTTKRHYRCRHCNDEITRSQGEFVADEPEEE
ncbi:MAG: hypothetical protein WC876_02320 [Candidatus Thermoplasmatota archaeon]